jgi:N-carbamoylputrescine amidase
MDKLTLCLACIHCEPGEIEGNLKKIKIVCSEAKEKQAQFVCFPEACISGYVLNPEELLKPFPASYVIDELVDISRTFSLTIMAGFIEYEQHDTAPYITQVITNRNGLVGKYRKTHLSPLEEKCYVAGNKIELYTVDNFCIGIQLCYETHFPELSTIMSLMGADIIFAPHASPRGSAKEKFNSWLRHLSARAFDNSVFVVACNQVGKTKANLYFPGVALALGPDGRLIDFLLTEDKEDILIVCVDRNYLLRIRSHKMRYFLPRRRPELYFLLTENKKRAPL